ncbi:cold-shock protein [Spirosoma sp. KNUC1025]|uniref:cold-shock protein n=1 Tax=Spirosoma sp. KNUC1025 TaxID=2894082 RepID=UPI003865EA81|nr:cold shock domain-containing protein [Spirosoma sp. KNUC1025]
METFSKREKENQRQKKKKEKQEKREKRKATSPKGQSLDQMLAYVDENGNLSSAPPDPRRKRQVNEEDISISVPKQEAGPQQEVIHHGIVSFFNDSKGYGFIRDLQTQVSIFVHINALLEPIGEQDKVSFAISMTPKGPNAIDVKKTA